MYNEFINEQINVLYELHILKHKRRYADAYEYYIRKLLSDCLNEYQMTAMLHDVKAGNETIEHLFMRKGVL